MDLLSKPTDDQYVDELSRLFYSFRLAQLSSRYYSTQLSRLKWADRVLQVAVALATAASFGLLSFADFSHVKVAAAILSVIAFILSAVIPGLGLSRKIEETTTRSYAWHFATQQLESALRFVKNSQNEDGEVNGWVRCAEEAYHQAAALPDTDIEDRKLIAKIEAEINESFPPDFVWTAF